MSMHTHISCPSCKSRLRIRPEYVGQAVACKFCHHSFLCEGGGDPDPAAPGARARPRPPRAGAGDGPRRGHDQGGTVEDAAQTILAKLLSRNRKYADLKQKLAQVTARSSGLAERVEELRAELDRVRDPDGHAAALLRELDDVLAERDGLGRRLGEIEAAAAESGPLRAELESARRRAGPAPGPCG